jgi:hypothetical protein
MRLACALVILVFGLTIVGILGGQAKANAGTSGCPQGSRAQSPPSSSQRHALMRNEPIRFNFEDRRGTSDRTEVVQAVPPLGPGSVVFADVEGDLSRADGGDSFPVEGISVIPQVTSAGDVQLKVCLDPGVEHVEPGRYVGVIQLRGADVSGTAIPLEATLSAGRKTPIACIVAGLILGVLLKALADLQRESRQGDGKRPSLIEYCRRPAFWTALILGVLGGVIGYFAVYATDTTWGTTTLDYVKLLAAGVSLQVTGMTAVDVVSPFRG